MCWKTFAFHDQDHVGGFVVEKQTSDSFPKIADVPHPVVHTELVYVLEGD